MTTVDVLYPFYEFHPVTQLFGKNPEMYAKYGLSGHNGIDYGCPVGTPVRAPVAGTVSRAGEDKSGYGTHVRIEMQDKTMCILGHLSALKCAVGDVVNQGQVVGVSGNTGNSTGPHLHLEIRPQGKGAVNFFDWVIYGKASQPDPRPDDAPPVAGSPGDVTFEITPMIVTATALNVRNAPADQAGSKVIGQTFTGAEWLMTFRVLDGAGRWWYYAGPAVCMAGWYLKVKE